LSKYSKCRPYFSGIGVLGVFFNRRRIVMLEIFIILLSCSGEAPELSIKSLRSLTVRMHLSPLKCSEACGKQAIGKLGGKVEENRRVEDSS
jgi:hypothetical protein